MKQFLAITFFVGMTTSLLACGQVDTTKDRDSATDKEQAYRKDIAAEAVAKARRTVDNYQKNYDLVQTRKKTLQEELDQARAVQKAAEEAVRVLEHQLFKAQKAAAVLDTNSNVKKLSYPQLWEAKRTASEAMQAAKREYDTEKALVSERLDALTNHLVATRSAFELFPQELRKVSQELYTNHFKEFLLYIFGLKLLWGIFTGYRSTFLYHDNRKITRTVAKYRSMANKTVEELKPIESLNIAPLLKDEFEHLHKALTNALIEMEQAPAKLIEYKDAYDSSAYTFSQTLSTTLEKFEESGEEVPNTPEGREYQENRDRFVNYNNQIAQLAEDVSSSINELITKYNNSEKAPIKRMNYDNARSNYLKAEAAEEQHVHEQNLMKEDLTKKRQEVEKISGQLKKASVELQVAKQAVVEAEARYEQIVPQVESAQDDLNTALYEQRTAEEEHSRLEK